MKRRSPAILASLVVGCAVLLALKESGRKQPESKDPAPEVKSATPTPAEDVSDEEVPPQRVVPPGNVDPSSQSKRFQLLADGSQVPPLAADAPDRVKLGVILFRYDGAEAPPKSERSKSEALKLARAAITPAQGDFAQAVKLGDRGSDENIGWIDQGILEPAVQYAIFSLEKGAVSSEPIDTPRGYWVARRVR